VQELPSHSPLPGHQALPEAAHLQILATEHWSLLAARTMLWNEMFTRATMLLTSLSAATVTLALVAQVSEFGDNFSVMALIVLPMVLVLGIGTYVRLGDARAEEAWQVIGMNRIRHAYIELAPELEPYFISGRNDDWPSVLQTYGPQTRMGPSRILASTPVIVGVIDAALVGVIVAVAVEFVDTGWIVHVGAGIVSGLAAAVVLVVILPFRQVGALRAGYQPRFPA